MDIRVPRIVFTDAGIDEAIEFMRIKSKDLDPGEDPDLKGMNIVLKADAEKAPRLNCNVEDVTFEKFFADFASATGLEVHLTDFGIVITEPGGNPSVRGSRIPDRVFYTFLPKPR